MRHPAGCRGGVEYPSSTFASLPALVLALAFATGCGTSADDGVSGGPGRAPTPPTSPPSSPPPTGGKWQGVVVENECGRTTVEWSVVDEVCGDTESASYLDGFEAPMFRDGALIDNLLYTVDATHLWVLDVTDPSAMRRQALLSGLGRPLAVAEHAGRLLVAAGDDGLLVLDRTDPLEPFLAARVELPGPALDVYVDQDRAYVANGAAGVAVVDLADPPALLEPLTVPGFAAAVKTRGGLAYVAACSTLAIVDLSTGVLVSKKWLDQPYDGELLVAPAKDVELVGDTAFVAAGRFGAVAVNVSVPESPVLGGNCTIADDLGFYASGLRAENDRLFVAGGEWGILGVDVSDPAKSCELKVLPTKMPTPTGSGGCSAEPPWEVLDWENRWAPPPPPPPDPPGKPPPGRDPIQVLPAGPVLFAFGDARRIGLRAVDARDPFDAILARVGRYDEPRRIVDLDARGERVLVVGPGGGLFRTDPTALLVPELGSAALARTAVAGALTEDGRYALVTDAQELLLENAPAPVLLAERVWANGLAVRGSDVIVPNAAGADVFDATGAMTASVAHGRTAQLPAVALPQGDEIVFAAPEWVSSLRVNTTVEELPAHGVFDAEQILDASLWQTGLPRRVLVGAGTRLVEIASLGARAGLRDHDSGETIALPAGDYVGAAAAGSRVYLVAADRSRYRSQLVAVELASDGPKTSAVETFTGVASDISVAGDRLYVADADGAIRVYQVAPESAVLLGVVRLEETP